MVLVEKTFLEFFAGIGLMRMGLEQRGWRIVWANDLDAAKRRMYDDHFGDAGRHFVLADVHKIDPASVLDATVGRLWDEAFPRINNRGILLSKRFCRG